jgi:hypothetical protein
MCGSLLHCASAAPRPSREPMSTGTASRRAQFRLLRAIRGATGRRNRGVRRGHGCRMRLCYPWEQTARLPVRFAERVGDRPCVVSQARSLSRSGTHLILAHHALTQRTHARLNGGLPSRNRCCARPAICARPAGCAIAAPCMIRTRCPVELQKCGETRIAGMRQDEPATVVLRELSLLIPLTPVISGNAP